MSILDEVFLPKLDADVLFAEMDVLIQTNSSLNRFSHDSETNGNQPLLQLFHFSSVSVNIISDLSTLLV